MVGVSREPGLHSAFGRTLAARDRDGRRKHPGIQSLGMCSVYAWIQSTKQRALACLSLATESLVARNGPGQELQASNHPLELWQRHLIVRSLGDPATLLTPFLKKKKIQLSFFEKSNNFKFNHIYTK
jgi:hypothetical protein